MALSKIVQALNLLSFSAKEKESIFKTIRLGIYFFILLFLVLGLWQMARKYGVFTFSETGPIENFQLIILLITGLLFLNGVIRSKIYRPLLLLFAGLIAFAFIREQDAFFESLIPVISWKFAWLFPIAGTLYLVKKRKGFKKIFFSFLSSNTFQLMFMAMVVFIPLAQCIGHRSFIACAIENTESIIPARRLIEESMELVTYVLILFSAIEMHWEFLKKKNK